MRRCRIRVGPIARLRLTGSPDLGNACASRHPGANRYVVLAKFLPGANPLVAGPAGAVPIRLERFLLYASMGALLWAGAWITLGYLFADMIARVATRAAPIGRLLIIVIAVTLTSYLVFKFVRRRRFLRHLWKARITPRELKRFSPG